ncbi:MAG: ATP-binding protein [Myxococcota bacterium]
MNDVDRWQERNRELLIAALADLGTRMAVHLGVESETRAVVAEWVETAVMDALRAESRAPMALDLFVEALGLDAFERDVVLLCAGFELHAPFVEICHRFAGQSVTRPTWSFVLSSIPGAEWSALAPSAPLRAWHVLRLEPGPSLVQQPIRLDEQILHYLLGMGIDLHLDRPLSMVDVDLEEQGSEQLHAIAARLKAGLERVSANADAVPAVQLFGPEAGLRKVVAYDVSQSLGLNLVEVALADLGPADAALDALLDRWERNALVARSALLVTLDDDGKADGTRDPRLRRLMGRLRQVPVFVSGRVVPPLALERPLLSAEVPAPSPMRRLQLWERALGPLAETLGDSLDSLASQFLMDAREIDAAVGTALGQLHAEEPERTLEGPALADALWSASRGHGRPRLDSLAQRLRVAERSDDDSGWEGLVLPPQQLAQLQQIEAHVRYSFQVWDRWGFDRGGARGVGVSALFYGESGTGKTHAAERLAARLRLDLYRVDLASIVSKYIGETEKNLRQIFDAADEGGVLLLFDEADAVFGRRSDVKDSHDRYANMEVSYLLQRIETARGISILTTNLRDAIDTAFQRRLRFVVEFPFPAQPQRAEIWRQIFPAATPTEGLQFDKLSRLNVTGGNIRNIALNGMFLAAEAGEPVQMRHLLAATRSEYEKLDKPLSQSDVGDWA